MVEIHFIQEVVKALTKSSKRHLCIHVGLSIANCMGCTLCESYIALDGTDVHLLYLLNVCGVSGPFCIFFLFSYKIECHHPIIIGSMFYLCCLFFHPLYVFL
jgi:hypothetical protein